MIAKTKDFVKVYHSEIVLCIVIISITIISFNLGRSSAEQGSGHKVAILPPSDQTAQILNAAATSKTPAHPQNSHVVASKKSTSKLYHFPWCPGSKQIAETNKITFASEAEAKTAGYSLAGNCQR